MDAMSMGSAARTPVLAGVAAILCWLAVLSLFLLSNLALAALGIPYEEPGGAGWTKFHPATFAALAGLPVLALSRGNPFRLLADIVETQPRLLWFGALWLAALLYVWRATAWPVSQVADTFLTGAVLTILVTRVSVWTLSLMGRFLHVLMFANALLGIAEFADGFRMLPLVAQGVELTGDWRSTAILGHPLQNAAITGLYVLILVLRPAGLPQIVRGGMIVLQLLALASFGGRAATAILFAMLLPAIAIKLRQSHRREGVRGRHAAVIVIALMAVAAGITVLASQSYFAPFLERFLADDGSAATRVAMFRILEQLPLSALLLGSDPESLATLQRLENTPFGIESMWVAMIAQYGLIAAGCLIAATGFLLWELRRQCEPQAVWVLLLFLLVCSVSTSLGGKTAVLSQLAVLLLVLMPRGLTGPAHP